MNISPRDKRKQMDFTKKCNFYQPISLVLSILKQFLLSVVHYNGHKIRNISYKITSKAKNNHDNIKHIAYQIYIKMNALNTAKQTLVSNNKKINLYFKCSFFFLALYQDRLCQLKFSHMLAWMYIYILLLVL